MFVKTNKNNLSIWGLLLPLTIFSKELGTINTSFLQIDLVSYPFLIIAFIVFFTRQKINITKNELIIFSSIFFIGILVGILNYLPIVLFLKQFIPLVIFYFSIKTIVENNDPVHIFDKYVDFATIAAILGIIQLILKPFGILFLTGLHGFYIDSLALEPSHYVVMMLPSLVYLYLKKDFSWKFWLILSTILLTFKLTAFLSLGLFLVVNSLRNYVKLSIFILPLAFIGYNFLLNEPEYAGRIEAAMAYFSSGELEDVNNMTTFSFISNQTVAIDNFINTYGLGVGLGGHETTYLRNFNVSTANESWYGLNYKSAHSFLIRVISELGVLGICLYFITFYKSLKINNTIFRAVALASLSHFIAKSLKLGSYFDYGTIFFLVMIVVMIQLDKQDDSSSQFT